MKKTEVQIGRPYIVKVSGREQLVKLDSESLCGGWIGTNVATKRRVRIKSAQRLRRVADVRNLGWANAWTETPELVKRCQKLAHEVSEQDVGPPNLGMEHVVRCVTCGYVYRFDSSD